MRIGFATVPGERHLVLINGRELKGFQRSDLKFLRLLYLATARATDRAVDGGGWVKKTALLGDKKDHALEAVAMSCASTTTPTSTRRSARRWCGPRQIEVGWFGSRCIRASPLRRESVEVPPHRRARTLSKNGERRKTPGAVTLEQNLAQARKIATKLLADARKFGVPELQNCDKDQADADGVHRG